MLSITWRKKKDSTERTRVVENSSSRNYSNEMIKYEAGSCCNHNHYSDSFLKFCYLCHKPLSGKEIYMYRGEMGFCSVECRSRQMYLDDMKKIEISTRRILASFHERRRHGGGRCETGTGNVVPAAAPPIFRQVLGSTF